ncbi:endonuclease [Candidatus Wolfebacteria bacterium]|nr:MAG: endonuclease [Candidatus Wolfebacteria bacterium]
MYYVYALQSMSRNYIYVGLTNNIERRLKEHNSGHNVRTRAYRPFKIIRTEEHPDRPSARTREKYLKSGVGKEFLKQL